MRRLCTLYRRFEHNRESFWIRIFPGLQPAYHLILAEHMGVRGFYEVNKGEGGMELRRVIFAGSGSKR